MADQQALGRLISVSPEFGISTHIIVPTFSKSYYTHVRRYIHMYVFRDHLYHMAHMWKSEDNLQVLFTFPTNWVPGAKLRLSALVARIFIPEPGHHPNLAFYANSVDLS